MTIAEAQSLVATERHGDVAVLWVDNPPVNAVSHAVREQLGAALRSANDDPQVRVLVLAGRGRSFLSGADIREFGKPGMAATVSVSQMIEDVRKPVIAALHGTALGGGYETALACDYRLAARGTVIGLPEVTLGILPGGGGTQRFPRLVGIQRAIEAMLTGTKIPTEVALEMGAIDQIVDGDLVDGAVDFARSVPGLRRLSSQPFDGTNLPADFFTRQAAFAARQRCGETAPARMIACVEAATRLSFEDGLKFEREQCALCLADPQSAAMRYAFFAERQARRIPGLDPAITPSTVAEVGVVGAGTMGGGIAMSFASAGIPVVLVDTTQEALDRGLAMVRRNYEGSVSRGRLTQAEADARLARIRPTLAYADFAHADLIVEAVFEALDLKQAVFGELDRVAKPGAVLASNTSRLSIDEMARATDRPQDVVGMHFFSPANVMRLCEVVRGPRTSAQTLATALGAVAGIGKVGVVSSDSNGFIGNRMLTPALFQAMMMLLEGATPEHVDTAIQGFGLGMGPFRMADLAGLEVGFKSRQYYSPDSLYVQSGFIADRLVQLGRFGQKTGGGYYDYEPGSRTPLPSRLVLDVIREAAQELGVAPRAMTEAEIAERYLLALVNEGCEVLREGVACRASDIDLVYLTGYGFPAYRGGPLYWAETERGLAETLDRIRDYADRTLGGWLRPSPLLELAVAERLNLEQAAARSAEVRGVPS